MARLQATIRRARDDEMDVVRELFVEYADWLGFDLCFQGFKEELAGLPGNYAEPRGGIWLACAPAVAGVVALRPIDGHGQLAELKRLWVRQSFRGSGLGRRLTVAAVDAARTAGYAAIRLDTLERMVAARSLYEELGFRRIEPYYDNPHEEVCYLQLDLRP